MPEKPDLRTYHVEWGQEAADVTAENEYDAWAKFCDGHTQAQRHPNAFERKITEIGGEGPAPEDVLRGAEPSEAAETQQPEVESDESPVDQLPAHDAIDRISRMRSRDRLNEIIANDQRQTVVHAARRRLGELPAD